MIFFLVYNNKFFFIIHRFSTHIMNTEPKSTDESPTNSVTPKSIFKSIKSSDFISTIPNMISSSRLFLSPLLLFTISNNYNITSLALFSSLAFSDYLDGKISRGLKQESPAGTILDPVADKALITCTILPLAMYSAIPLSLASLALLKDFVIGREALKMLNSIKSASDPTFKKLSPSYISKVNSTINYITCMLVLISNTQGGYVVAAQTEIFILASISNLLTVLTAAQRNKPDALKKFFTVLD
ncbi:MAG: hypothetical protein MHMPM18_001246 [Marteilia pararefringens]